ncbi:carbohydrate porin [Vibrio sp. PNB23_22_6]
MNWSDDIHILDRKYYEIRSPGIGVKGIAIDDAKLDLFMTSHDSDGDKTYTDENGTEVTYEDDARPRTHTLGMEYRSGAWWLTASIQSNSSDSRYSVTRKINGVEGTYIGETATTGAHLMVNYTQPSYFGLTNGRDKYGAQYATGTSAAFLGRHGDTNQSNDGGQNYRVFIDGLATIGNWDINTIALFQQKNDVDFDGSENQWWTIGGRSAYYFSDNLALQFEAGYNGSSYASKSEQEEGGVRH